MFLILNKEWLCFQLDLEDVIGMFGEETCNTSGSRLVPFGTKWNLLFVMVDS